MEQYLLATRLQAQLSDPNLFWSYLVLPGRISNNIQLFKLNLNLMTKHQQTHGHTLLLILSFSILTLLVPTSILAQDSSYFEFGGYMRSGFGIDGKGGPHDVFKAPNSEANKQEQPEIVLHTII